MNIKTSVILFFAVLNFLSPVHAYNCDERDMKYDAYCTYISGPEGANKFVKINDDQNYVATACMNTRIGPLSIPKEAVQDGSISVGKHIISFSQCDTIMCDNEIALASDTLTVLPNKSVDHSRYSFGLNPAYGESCNVNVKPENAIGMMKAANCDQYSYAPYCATINNPVSVNKFVKVVSDNGMSYTFCVNSTTAYVYPKPSNTIAHTLQFLQCDTVECKNQKLLGKDTVTLTADGKADHARFTFALDPTFGESCKPILEKNK